MFLLAQGVNIKQIQEFLGHSDVTTTLNIYTHTDEEAKKETAAAMGRCWTCTKISPKMKRRDFGRQQW